MSVDYLLERAEADIAAALNWRNEAIFSDEPLELEVEVDAVSVNCEGAKVFARYVLDDVHHRIVFGYERKGSRWMPGDVECSPQVEQDSVDRAYSLLLLAEEPILSQLMCGHTRLTVDRVITEPGTYAVPNPEHGSAPLSIELEEGQAIAIARFQSGNYGVRGVYVLEGEIVEEHTSPHILID